MKYLMNGILLKLDLGTSWKNSEVTPALNEFLVNTLFNDIRIPVTWHNQLKKDTCYGLLYDGNYKISCTYFIYLNNSKYSFK